VWTINEDVIKENQDKLLKVRFQYFIHDTLEGGWSIAKAKRHDQEFIMSLMSSESKSLEYLPPSSRFGDNQIEGLIW
jgi:hypothetical protein